MLLLALWMMIVNIGLEMADMATRPGTCAEAGLVVLNKTMFSYAKLRRQNNPKRAPNHKKH
uniref:Uncharacterized protein n=1 Tax=Romanomermis culicivorax TaxID=13658 RepID=A0A915KYP8_ROMCU